MSTIVFAAMLVAGTISLLLLFTAVSKKNIQKQNKKNIEYFHRVASKNGLFFSGLEVLRDKIIALDEVKKVILVYEFKKADNVISINLVNVINCSVNKTYENVNIGSEKKVRLERNLKSIDVLFTFKNGDKAISVSFYDSSVNNIYEMAELEAKAKDWETEAAKLISKKHELTA